MNSEIICVAADNLPEEHSGFLTSYISKKLFELGHRTTFESVAAPDRNELYSLMEKALSRSDLIFILGGIEPESSSAAKTALAAVTGAELTASEEALRSVKEYCMSIGREPSTEQLSAAIMPKGAEVFKNELGLCPGLAVDYKGKKIVLLPSTEGELTHMFEAYVAPLLSPHGVNVSHTVNIIGLSEEELENKLSSVSGRSEYTLTVKRRGAELALWISAVANSKAAAEAICMKAVAAVKFALGRAAYAVDSKGLQFEVVSLLRDKGLTVSTAESCTAGMVSEMLTDVGGSSKVFEYGISAYSNRIKNEVLGVDSEILEKYSAISAETAKHMAINVRVIGKADIGIAITGNAGPAPSEGKPVGQVFVAIADGSSYIVKELSLSASLSRDEIRERASLEALELVRRYTLSYPDGMNGMINYTPRAVTPAASAAPAEDNSFILPVSNQGADNSSEAIKAASIIEENSFAYDNKAIVFDRETDSDFIGNIDSEEYNFANKGMLAEGLKNLLRSLSSFFSGIFPVKGDSAKRVFVKISFLVSLLTFVTSAVLLFMQLTADNEQRELLTTAQEEWVFDNQREEDNTFTAFNPLQEKNEDVRGWISISGTKVNNPIYQTTDNEYYLTHNMYKEKSRYGALFFDYRCKTGVATSQNLIVYGHEMRDGSMFGTLKSFKSLSFYKVNPTISLTLLEKQTQFKIFAVMVINADPTDDNGYMFNYITPSFKSQTAFLEWVAEAKERSIINTNVDVAADDQVLTLVTCINEFDNARFVIMGRMVREGEDSSVDVSSATLNPNPRYPQAWYDKRGLAGYATSSETEAEDTASDTDSSEGTVSDGAASESTPSDTVSSADSSAPTTSSAPSASDTSSAASETASESDGGGGTAPPSPSTEATVTE